MDEIELIEKRKPREKHFLQKDGTIRAEIYDTDIHYLKDGKYEEIDNTLVKENDLLVNKSNDYRVEFKENFRDSLMKMSKDDHYIDFKLKESRGMSLRSEKRMMSNDIQNITYNDITDDIKIEYQTLSNKVKETIVLQNSNYSELSFELDTNLNLEDNNGEIVSKDENGNIIFRIEKPFMVDSNGIRNDKIHYLLCTVDNKYVLSLVLDDEWLNDKDRKYPVYIDPTITNNSNDITLQDTYIYPGDSNDVRYNKEYFKCGVEKVNGVDRQNIGLLKFSIPTLGTGSAIVKAELSLIPYKGVLSDVADKFVEIHRILDEWNVSEANWNNMNGKFDESVEAVCNFSRSPIYDNVLHLHKSSVDITKIVKKWYEDYPNYGLMIKSCNSNYIDDQFQMYYATENGLSVNPKPVISITYKNYNGIESYLDYKIHDLTRGKSLINTFNGNVTNLFNVASTVGGRLPVCVNLIYNTNDAVLNNMTNYGRGFKLNFEENIIIKSLDVLQYNDGDGTIHYFNKKEDSSLNDGEEKYCDEDDLGLDIIKTETYCILKDGKHNEKKFSFINNKYYLIKITDSKNNFIDIVLNDNCSISEIIDKNGKKVAITYLNDKIILCSENNTTVLNYDDCLLKSIMFDLGTLYINYNSNNIISSILDTDGLNLSYEYYNNSPYKIKKVMQYGINNAIGRSYSLCYSYDSTEITDNLGLKEILTYNEYGNVKSKNSLKGINEIASAYSREKTFGVENNKNKILSDMIPFRYTKNYLKNSSFEVDTNYFSIEDGIALSFDSAKHRTGGRSLKISSSEENKSIIRNVNVEKGKYYTFSGYFINSIKAKISLLYEDINGNIVCESRSILPSYDFEREDVTILYGSNAKNNLLIKITLEEIGSIYLDDVQLENGEVANNYNMFEDSDFSDGLTGWIKEAYSNDGISVSSDNCMNIVTLNENNDKALKISMNPLKITKISKKFDVKGTAEDVFTLSFWYKNEGVMPFEPSSGCTVSINFEPYDTDYGQGIIIVPLPVTGDGIWQHFTHREGPPSDFKSITVSFVQYASANDFYLTDLSFYKNMCGEDYEYDEFGNIVSLAKSNHEALSFKYDINNQLIKMTTPLGKNFEYEYDLKKPTKLLSAISESGICNEIRYDKNDNPVSTIISKKIMTEIADGKYKIRCKGTRKYLKAEYNNILLEESECSNTVWNLKYENNKCKFSCSMLPDYFISYLNNNIILSNGNKNNELILEKTSSGSYYIYIKFDSDTTKYFKAIGNTLELYDLDADDSSFEFYIELPDEMFIEMDANYSEDGRYITDTITTSLIKEKYEIDDVSGLRTTLYSKNQKYSYAYNDKNQIISIRNNAKLVTYEYNSNNLLCKINVGNKVYNLEYDEFLKSVTLKLGDNIKLVEKEFDNDSQRIKRIKYANGNSVNCYYDDFDRVGQLVKFDDSYIFKYDSNNNLAKIKSNNNTKRYRYDIVNKLYEYDFDNMKINYKYDADDNVVSKVIKLNGESHSLGKMINMDDELEKLTIDVENEIDYEYDNLCRIRTKKINNLYQTNYSYKSNGRRATLLIDSIENNNDKYSYSYNDCDNIKFVYHNNDLLYEYTYDDYNQLITEKDYKRNIKNEFVYDLYGNIINKFEKNLSDGSVKKINTYLYSNNNWKDQLTLFNNEKISYDQSGNPTSIGNSKITWKNGKELAKYSDENNNISYTYDEKGIRTSKIVNNIKTSYYLEGNKIVFEVTENNTIFFIRSCGEIIGFKYNGNLYYYIKNGQNDVIGILDSNYNRIVDYYYDAWGNITDIIDNSSNGIGTINPIRYRSYYYDRETNLYYLNSRYYNPEWGRFLNADDNIGLEESHIGYNMYVYAVNNPVNNVDYDGNLSFKQICNSVVSFFRSAYLWTKNTFTTLKDKAIHVYNVLSDAFVVELGSGIGYGYGVQLGSAKAEFGWKKKFGTGWTKEGSYQYTKQEFDVIDLELYNKHFGFSKEITSYDPTMNPMATLYDLAQDPNVEVTTVEFLDKYSDFTVENNKCFIGFSISLYNILGGDFKIGFAF